MSSPQPQSDTAILQMLLPNLEEEGFRVFLHPSRSMLPRFMQGYQPDAIAMKADKKVAIEVKSSSGHAEPQIQKLQEMFSLHPDWELRIIYAPTQNAEQALAVTPRKLVIESLDRLPKIFDEAGPIPALLTGWSVFEAAARGLIPESLGRPQAPERLLEKLASEGYITPEEADALRILGKLRSHAAHGRLDVAITRDQLAELVSITHTLIELPDANATS
jgi:hypothetical protein